VVKQLDYEVVTEGLREAMKFRKNNGRASQFLHTSVHPNHLNIPNSLLFSLI